jgi:hypothetical protein
MADADVILGSAAAIATNEYANTVGKEQRTETT